MCVDRLGQGSCDDGSFRSFSTPEADEHADDRRAPVAAGKCSVARYFS